MTMLRTLLIAFGAATFLTTQAAEVSVTSPDGAVRFVLSADAEGHLLYSVTQGGQATTGPCAGRGSR